MADDLDVEAAGPDFRAALFVVFTVASVVGIPIAWKKVLGGTMVEWIGYELRLVGVSAGRAALAVKWCKGFREAGIANTAAVEEGVGRLSFIAALRFLEHSLTQRHQTDCTSCPLPFCSALRVDAQAGEGTVGIGAWWPYLDEGVSSSGKIYRHGWRSD